MRQKGKRKDERASHAIMKSDFISLLLFFFLVSLLAVFELPSANAIDANRNGVIIATKSNHEFLSGKLIHVGKTVESTNCYESCLSCGCGWVDPLSPACYQCESCYGFHWDCPERPTVADRNISDTDRTVQYNNQSTNIQFSPVFYCNCSGASASSHLENTTMDQHNIGGNYSVLQSLFLDCSDKNASLVCQNTCMQSALNCTNAAPATCQPTCTASPGFCIDCINAQLAICTEAARTCMANTCGITQGS